MNQGKQQRESIESQWANQATSLCGLLYKLFPPLNVWKNRHQETVYWQQETFTETNPWEIKSMDNDKHTYFHWRQHNVRKYVIHWFSLLSPSASLACLLFLPSFPHSPAILFSDCNYTNTLNAFFPHHCQDRHTSMTQLPVLRENSSLQRS